MERVFEPVGRQDGFKLENQNGAVKEFRDIDIEDYLEDMFASPDQFVTLTAPEAQHKVRFVQACMQKDSIEVELGIEENGRISACAVLVYSKKRKKSQAKTFK